MYIHTHINSYAIIRSIIKKERFRLMVVSIFTNKRVPKNPFLSCRQTAVKKIPKHRSSGRIIQVETLSPPKLRRSVILIDSTLFKYLLIEFFTDRKSTRLNSSHVR